MAVKVGNLLPEETEIDGSDGQASKDGLLGEESLPAKVRSRRP